MFLCQAAFDDKEAKAALSGSGKCYRCAANLFWLDICMNATPSVPLDYDRVTEWSNTIFSDGPSHLKEMIVIGVSHPDDPAKTKGQWRQVSPEELTHSIIFKLAEAVNKPEDEATLRQWKAVILSAPVMFMVLDGEDAIYWQSWSQRQRHCLFFLFFQTSCFRLNFSNFIFELYPRNFICIIIVDV